MKWIGQHIVDFIARFRSDVYLEDISTGTIASGGNLGLDSNNKIVKADEDGATLTTEAVQDIVGGMFSSNTETRVAATYVDGGDGAGKINIVVDDMTANTTYSIQDGELSQNNFTNDDHTKLDGIEASADVTDATNVTAAGALMDSEISNLAFVKSLTGGIANTNVLKANANIVDNDFLRVDGTSIEGRSSSEVLSDIGAQLSIGDGDLTIAFTDELQDTLDLKAPIAGPTFTGTVAIPNIANVETAIANNTAKATNVSTNLTATTHASQITINSSDGTNVVVAEASDTIAGLMTTTHHDKLDGIEASATADQSNAEIRAAVEAATDSNVFTDADHTKLNGIEASATADQTQADINGLAITTVGTIGTGVWNGTAIASAYLDADTVHLSVDQEITSKTQINKRQFSAVGASAGDCEGDIIYFGSDAASHVAGNIYTLNSSSQWVVTDADATATSIGLLAVAMGTAASDGMCIRGMANLNTTFAGSPDTGAILYLDGATPGAATGTAPTGNGDIVRVLGYKIGSGTRMWFNPDNTFVEVTA